MMITRLLCAVALGWALASCASHGPGSVGGTGVEGTVTVGPTCPVERADSPCPPRPLAATVLVRDASGSVLTRVRSGADGHFKVDLAPGSYTLTGDRPAGAALPRPITSSVTVIAGAYTVVTVQYDSGIR
jgi:hypothetical protein